MTKAPETKNIVKNRKIYSAPALEKGLDILELLASEANGLNISEVTKKLGRSVGELFRMLMVLEQRNYIEIASDSDRYRLTLKMFGVANRFPPMKKLTIESAPILQLLASDIGQSCHIVVHYRGKGHVVVQQEPPLERVFSVRLGAEVPLINSCSGHVLLAFSGGKQSASMIDNIPDHHQKPEMVKLEHVLDRVRKQGFESILSAQTQGVKDVGYPIFDHHGNIVAVLSVPFLEYIDGSHKLSFLESKFKIKDAAEKISMRLGNDS